MPGYERQVMTRPPGIAQQQYWEQASARAPAAPPIATHARAEGGHVAGFVQGFSKVGLGTTKPKTVKVDEKRGEESYPLQLATAIFGRGGLAPAIPADRFMLESSEFDDIARWIQAGAATPVVAHGTASGALTRLDDVQHDLASAREITNWSEYFASSDYRDKFMDMDMAFPTALRDA